MHEALTNKFTDVESYDQALEQKFERLAADPVIDPASVNLDFVNPERVRETLWVPGPYMQRGEGEVSLNGQHVRLGLGTVDETTERFLNIWVPQEQGHAITLEETLTTLDIPLLAIDTEANTKGFEFIGQLSEHVPKFRDIFMLIYLARGAMHEKLTAGGYRSLETMLTEIGEVEFVRTALKPIQKQEAGHLGYYLLAAKRSARLLDPWQIYMARAITAHTYRPVAASSKQRQKEFGAMQRVVVPEGPEGFEAVAEPIQSIADEIFKVGTPEGAPRPLRAARRLLQLLQQEDTPKAPKYVYKALEYCHNLSEAAELNKAA